jgi:predicted lipoprotein with Yx(FWY)xxD motif
MNAGKRTATAAGGVLVTAAVLTGCGGGGGGYSDGYGNAAAPAMTMPGSSTISAAPAPSVKPSVSARNPSVPAFELIAKQTKALGWVVTDGKGWILYRFDKDHAKPTAWSACTGACAEKWPPVLVHGTPVLKGVSRSIVGKMRRADGTWQLTLHGWPVYRFAGDTSPGQWKGQGVGGTWHTVKRTGARNTIKVTWPAGKASGGASSSPGSNAQPTISDGYGNTSNY